ncbi:MAG: hypothetical protein V4631_09015 [Pseudomonadota bacterium]
MQQQARTNTALSLIIEQGIARDLLHGSVLAWKFMAAHGVPNDMIARVLAHPGERRQSDAPAGAGEGRRPASNDPASCQPLPD